MGPTQTDRHVGRLSAPTLMNQSEASDGAGLEKRPSDRSMYLTQ